LSFGDGLIAAEVNDLREPWMAHADAVLADEQLMTTVYEALAKLTTVYEALAKRHPPARPAPNCATAAAA
jgi:hypothetical protein